MVSVDEVAAARKELEVAFAALNEAYANREAKILKTVLEQGEALIANNEAAFAKMDALAKEWNDQLAAAELKATKDAAVFLQQLAKQISPK